MTVDRVKAVAQKHVLVGVQLDGHSRELLSWALVKVAEPGDRVLAIHVCRDDASQDGSMLDDYLEVYEGLCNAKKVNLSGQLLRGTSFRKVLVREAKNYAAVALLVGIDKQGALGVHTGTAKYCAKRLPSSTDVLAIHNGKIVFRKCTNIRLPGLRGDPRPSFCQTGRADAQETSSEFGDSEVESEISTMEMIQSFREEWRSGYKDVKNGVAHENRIILSRSASELSGSRLEQRPGWPLLRRATSDSPRTLNGRSVSVVQWVMSLPDRSMYLNSLHPDTRESPPQKYPTETVDISHKSSSPAASKLLKQMELLLRTKSSDCELFDYDALRDSTSQFSSEHLIGKGGSNCVYKGTLPDGTMMAVKVLKSSVEANLRDFLLEMDIISSIKQKNITPLRGISVQRNSLISVYNFLFRGSLEENLHGDGRNKHALSWPVRYNIALGVAEALNYLHNECAQPVIHRDVKTSNILLTNEFEPQLSDFGLAIWGPPGSAFLTKVDVVGTFGYLAPEYFMYGKLSDKVDVYAFGAVLLELLSGRKPVSSDAPKGQESLVMWAKPIIESVDARSILDPDLGGHVDEVQVQRMVLAARLCITQSARLRPNMNQILKILNGDVNVDEWLDSKSDHWVDSEISDDNDDEVYPNSSAESHLSLALLDVCDDSTSFSSTEQRNSISVEEYMKRRWSRSSSFD
ncbi:protein kinase STUNTED isoform X1 [Rhodamnia argentea]|uniref:Protein kinase STUNTED isoform X1 n=1 Tax=Rhodamnia argentea TaxID=178133 RepID=A0A8B8NM93_9MYRT|nr:protein kinase STUNTED isoform X1 [Rhodamnia argentea]